jgi:hypothetical protein
MYTLNNIDVVIDIKNYENTTIIRLIDAEDGSPYATASKYVPDFELNQGEILIKNYSENVGILEFLIENNIVSDTGKKLNSGYIQLHICILNNKEEWKSPIYNYQNLLIN